MKLFSHLLQFRGHTVWGKGLDAESVIIDGGAHEGDFSRQIQKKFGCRCILIEANPNLASKIDLPPKAVIVNAALAGYDSKVQFIVRENLEGGSIFAQSGEIEIDRIAIDALSITSLKSRLALERIDLLKLDIEGAEFDLISNTPDHELVQIAQITVEFHDFLKEFQGIGLFKTSRERLRRLGFVCCPMSFRNHGDVLFLNRSMINLSSAQLLALSILGRWVFRAHRYKSSNSIWKD